MLKEGTIRTVIEGKTLPFITVDEGITYGEAMVELARAEREEALRNSQMFIQQSQMMTPYQVFPNTEDAQRDLQSEEIDALNFNKLLDAEKEDKNMQEQQEKLEGQKEEHVGREEKDLEEKLIEEKGEESIEAKKVELKGKSIPSKVKTEKEKETKVKTEISNNLTHETNQRSTTIEKEKEEETIKEDRVDEKELREVSNKEVKRNELDNQLENNVKEKIEKTIDVVARSEEKVYSNDDNGKDIYAQTEVKKERGISQGSPQGKGITDKSDGKANSVAKTIDDAKSNIKAENFMRSVATVTHITGRTTELNIGKDVLQFRKEGDETNAYRNGEQIGPKDTKEMIKNLEKEIGEKGMNRIVALSKNPVVQQRSMNDLMQMKTSGIQKEKSVSTKTKDQRI